MCSDLKEINKNNTKEKKSAREKRRETNQAYLKTSIEKNKKETKIGLFCSKGNKKQGRKKECSREKERKKPTVEIEKKTKKQKE